MKELAESALNEYRRKRNFRRTAEPPARVPRNRGASDQLFVIQKHDATRLHYDFRLHMSGVLKSWAVPKGLPAVRGKKHLAVQVEDHPLDYAHFEGTISEGNYGAGTVMVWDTGTYLVHGTDPGRALAEGKIHLTLRGKKLRGDWTLVRLRPRAGEIKTNWLIFKSGEDAKPVTQRQEDQSALTRRSMARIARDNTRQWGSSRPSSKRATPLKGAVQKKKLAAAAAGAPRGQIKFVDPMKCRLLADVPRGTEWVYEIKFDGYRALAFKRGSKIELISRANKTLAGKFPEVEEGLRHLACAEALLDGEVVAVDEKGRSSFQLLQMAQMAGDPRPPILYYVFDLLHLDGHDLKSQPLSDRKEILRQLLDSAPEPIRFSASLKGEPEALLDQARKLGLEGIIAKRSDSIYEAGRRSGAWAKIKILNEQEFVIGGYTLPQGSRKFFGAILVGYYDGNALKFSSKVGTGFSEKLLASMYREFQRLRREQCPFVNLPEKHSGRYGQGVTAAQMKRCVWLRPELVGEVRFTEWTRDGHLRHPAFMGLRDDKRASEVTREKTI